MFVQFPLLKNFALKCILSFFPHKCQAYTCHQKYETFFKPIKTKHKHNAAERERKKNILFSRFVLACKNHHYNNNREKGEKI